MIIIYILYQVQEDDIQELMIIPPENFNGEFTIEVIGTSTDLTGSEEAVTNQIQSITFEPANDAPRYLSNFK